MTATLIAVAALLVSIAAAWYTRRSAGASERNATASEASATAARDSADEARRANELAEEANERAKRADQMALSGSNVAWEHTWHDENDVISRNVLSYQNIGTDTAHDVALNVDALDIEAPRKTERWPSVDPKDRIGINLNSLAQEAKERWERAHDLISVPAFEVRVTITWKSELGVPDKMTETLTL